MLPRRSNTILPNTKTDEQGLTHFFEFPKSPKDLTKLVDRDENKFLGGGSFGDVYMGIWKDKVLEAKRGKIVVKVMRLSGSIDSKTTAKHQKKLRRELAVWQNLDHPNIVPFVGTALISGSLPSIVSAWMSQGDLSSYLIKEPNVSRDQMAIDIAQGLKYLHGLHPCIIHGDLKPDNVLIDEGGSARLCDFGLSRMIDDSALWQTSATTAQGTVRWESPELLSGAQPTVTTQADIYAYAMTCFEVYSGLIPFHRYRNDWVVMNAVLIDNEIPERMTVSYTINNDLWDLWTQCWDRNSSNRPTASNILDRMAHIECAQRIDCSDRTGPETRSRSASIASTTSTKASHHSPPPSVEILPNVFSRLWYPT